MKQKNISSAEIVWEYYTIINYLIENEDYLHYCCINTLFDVAFSSIIRPEGSAERTCVKNDTTNTDKGSAGSAIGSILGNVLGKSDVTPADLEGTWNYTAPAVTFKSENLLKKAGGAAASATIENKIKPYYQRAGLENLVLTVANDSTFTMKLKRGSLSGSIAQGTEKGILVFKFKAAGR